MVDDTKKLLNEVLVKLFNKILFNEEKSLLKLMNNDISIHDIHILEAISLGEEKDDVSANTIAKSLNITAGTLTTAIKKLEKKGYVIRRQDDIDKRKVNLILTKKGENVNTKHENFHKQMVDEIMKDLSVNDEMVLLIMLEKILKYFEIN
ncbi:MAG: MarR family transcriptional regulator [Bacilli bacterium]|jgi:DNA-binding MarR family transcriptional regulator|nr:MarR family transcriptional regulator [Bacilli bacterium]MDD2682208.1 MarR family transcriptional regulator [Bacilli bacterium]MDD3121657.1 MarR family transcriptional regulator [Bacilli bacterium]MDD4063734.1 MarR family transcriptional regulator [Bacilli bacterium]MDD4482435.1 MarR family transcriptional regulator [Bacilli bacterium]